MFQYIDRIDIYLLRAFVPLQRRKTEILLKYFYRLLIASASPITKNTNGNLYENAFFGLSVEKPKGWVSQDMVQLFKTVLPMGSIIFGNKNEFTQEFIDSAIKKMFPLFGFSKYSYNIMNRKPNPNILAISENIQAHSSIKTACDYLNVAREPLKNSLHKVTFLNECHEVDINGKMFATQSFTMKIMGVPLVKQTHYAKMAKNDYILLFSLTYFNRVSKIELDNVMHSLKFSQE